MSLYGVGLNVQVDRIKTEFRLYVSKQKGGLNVRNLRRIFEQLDYQQSGQLNLDDFKAGLNKFGFFLKNVDYQCLLKYFDVEQNGHVSYLGFLSCISETLNQRRVNFVLKVFDSVDSEQKGAVHPFSLAERLEVVKNKDYQIGSKTREQLVGEYVAQFHKNQDGLITRDEFISYYEDLGLGISSDQHFIEILQNQWGIKEDDDLAITKEEVKGIVKTIRQKLIQKTKGANDEFLLRKLFKEFDISNSGFLTLDEMNAMLIKLEIPIQKRYLNAVFSQLDRNHSGVIEFEEFVYYIVNDPYP
ncbi:hypothetical protein ABPG74_009581 [Tetrahymena malaccensis]